MRLLPLVVSAAVLAVGVLPALAQTPSPTAPGMDKTSLSKSCSAQADAKGLHGKVRKHFRSACKHGH